MKIEKKNFTFEYKFEKIIVSREFLLQISIVLD